MARQGPCPALASALVMGCGGVRCYQNEPVGPRRDERSDPVDPDSGASGPVVRPGAAAARSFLASDG